MNTSITEKVVYTYDTIVGANIISLKDENVETRLIKDEVDAILKGKKGYCFNAKQVDNILYKLHEEKPDQEYIGKCKGPRHYEITPKIVKKIERS